MGGRAPAAAKGTKPSLGSPKLQQQALDKTHFELGLHPVRSSSFSRLPLSPTTPAPSPGDATRTPFYLSCWTTSNSPFPSRPGPAAADHHHPVSLASTSTSTSVPFSHYKDRPHQHPRPANAVQIPVSHRCWPSHLASPPMTAPSIRRSVSLPTTREKTNRLNQPPAETHASRCKNT